MEQIFLIEHLWIINDDSDAEDPNNEGFQLWEIVNIDLQQ